MATLDSATLLDLMQRRWDSYSARAVQHEMFSALGLDAQAKLGPAEIERIISWLEHSDRRADVVVSALRALAVVAAPPIAAPEPPAHKHAPPAAKQAPHAKHAAPVPVVFDIAVGGLQECACPPGAAPRIVSDRPGTVRWGVDGWKRPADELQPANTVPGEGDSVDTRLVAAHGAFELRLPPLPASLRELDFNVRFEDGTWAKDVKIRLA